MNTQKEPIGEHLLLRYLLGKITPEENLEVEAWLGEGESNRQQLDRLEALWLESGRLVPAPIAVDVDRAWDRQDHDSAPVLQVGGGIRRLRYVYGIAAAIVLLIGVYTLIRLAVMKLQPLEWVASAGMVRDTLPDGSEVILHAGSTFGFLRNSGRMSER
jgi:ferric-dicitrate binding protein FerR (iron transport regulator)